MEHLLTYEYKGFRTDFYLTPKVKRCLSGRGVDLREHLVDKFTWYEHLLFELLNPDLDKNWSEEKETHRRFKVVFYGVVEDLSKEPHNGFVESFEYDRSKVLYDSILTVHREGSKPFAVGYVILVV